MAAERFKLPVVVFLLLVQNGKVLLLRRLNSGWYDGYYDLVAGHIEVNETLSEAICREALEEVGIVIQPANARFVQLIHSYSVETGNEYLHVYFTPTDWSGKPSIMEPDKSDDLQWFPLDHLPTNLAPGTKNALETFGSGKNYLERGFDHLVR